MNPTGWKRTHRRGVGCLELNLVNISLVHFRTYVIDLSIDLNLFQKTFLKGHPSSWANLPEKNVKRAYSLFTPSREYSTSYQLSFDMGSYTLYKWLKKIPSIVKLFDTKMYIRKLFMLEWPFISSITKRTKQISSHNPTIY